ncbi:auxin-responsive protein SAUR32-like [Amaranthus tricolor]|uniref:auxin-responsive protein SAUR32-like n=1 Tax=Amaranthus tricolor TaxID=29722 RepID=UPI0025826E1C|nr:auxin-responsive protein SAUR32-like [Amaranthus tricolor]
MGGNFHLHLPHKKHQNQNNQGNSSKGNNNNSNNNNNNNNNGVGIIPKGCLAIKVGQTDEEQQRFVVPVVYFNHPLFMRLLKEAEDEYGFDQKGTITIPCHVEEFRYVQALIDRDKSINHHHHHSHHHHHHHHNPIVSCFRA